MHVVGPVLDDDPEQSRRELARGMGGGVLLADLDGDGPLDLYLPQTWGANGLCWGLGDGSFDCDAGAPPAALPDVSSFAASAADADGDGDLDLAVLGLDSFHVFENRGGRQLVDVTSAWGFEAQDGFGTTMAWADVDLDGDLDLFVGWHAVDLDHFEARLEPSWDRLWRNDGGAFTDAAAFPWPDDDGAVFQALFRDFDDDGDPDLLQLNDLGATVTPSFLWANTPEGWVDRWPHETSSTPAFPMGASVIDLDGDGRRDIVTSNIGRPQAWRGADGWDLISAPGWSAPLPSGDTWVSWSVVPYDVHGIGQPELLFTYGALGFAADPATQDPVAWAEQPDRLLSVEEGRLLVLLPATSPASRGAAVGDLDGDLIPDLVIGRLDAPPSILLNRCASGGWVLVDLRDDSAANRFAIGAKVTVDAGGTAQFREVSAGGPGTFSDSGPTLYFGVGEADTVRITVRWTDGSIEVHDDVPTNRRTTLFH